MPFAFIVQPALPSAVQTPAHKTQALINHLLGIQNTPVRANVHVLLGNARADLNKYCQCGRYLILYYWARCPLTACSGSLPEECLSRLRNATEMLYGAGARVAPPFNIN